jgi:hypothetical protein
VLSTSSLNLDPPNSSISISSAPKPQASLSNCSHDLE